MASRTIGLMIRAAHADVCDRDLLQRFAAGDQAAFALLVRRHSDLVLGVCRRSLATVQDAEDACQATFLILARKAASGRWQPSIANWLHATARKVARNARRSAERRAKREHRAAVPESSSPIDSVSGREFVAMLDEELDKLPPIYREPLILCCLAGLTRDEAASRLRIPVTTLKTRLERARKRLGEALTKRGCALGVALLAFAATSRAAASSLSLRNSILTMLGGPIPPSIAALAEEATMSGVFTKSIIAAVAIVAVAVLGAGAGAGKHPGANPMPEQPAKPADTVKLKPADEKGKIAYTGRVVGPDGKTVESAKLYVTHAGGYLKEPQPSPEFGAAGANGRFDFSVPHEKFADNWTVVAATAPGYGVGWTEVRKSGGRDNLTIQLAKDDVPITGQIVDLQGRPIAGVTLTVLQINAAADEDLGPWQKAAKANEALVHELEHKYLNRFTFAVAPKVTTDANGRFTLTGIGRERLVRAQLDGPTIGSQQICVVTRLGAPIEVTYNKGNAEYGEPRIVTTYYGADFRHAAAPCQPIVGVVRDKDTKAPLAGVTIRSHSQIIGPSASRGLDVVVKTTTDAQGRYRLTGISKGKGYTIAALPGSDQPYVPIHVSVPDMTGLDPVTVDIDLKRGVWIEGRITDKTTGKPVKGSVEYFSIYSNPNLYDYPGYDGTILMGELWASAKEDGTFRVVGLPGPGLLGVYYQKPPYLRASDRTDEFGTKERSFETAPYHLRFTSNYNALARVEPAKGAASIHCDVTVEQRPAKPQEK